MAIESKMNRGPIGHASLHADSKKPGAWVWIVGLLVIAILGVAWFYFTQRGSSPTPAEDSAQEAAAPIQSGEYQAVFLDNGQVYFGKLERLRDEFYTLTDVFYLQSGVAVDQNTNLALTKLGSEAHGPIDRMEINEEHVLFIEDMKDDSKVVQAIQQYKSSKP